MDYTDAVNYIHELSKFGSKPGLERVSRLVSLVDNPQNDLKFIHFAGTSGKGSTASFCAGILSKAGYKVGLYTSPYVIDFRERFQINGEMISEDEFCSLCSRLIGITDKMRESGEIITEFEFNTVLGLLWFKQSSCDVVCLEVGMGGRFDATNLIPTPEVAVITRIGLDHTAFLGDTVEKIAFEKCGIIKKGGRVVSYPLQKNAATDVINNICRERLCPLTIPEVDKISDIRLSLDGSEFTYLGNRFTLSMNGEHQIYNAVTAVCAVQVLQECSFEVPKIAFSDGLYSVKCAARIEVISKDPLIIIDGAHNSDKIQSLYDFVKKYEGRIVAVCGMLKDKDYEKAVEKIVPLCKSVFAVTPENPRALDSESFMKVCEKYCDRCHAFSSVCEGTLSAIASLSEEDVFLCWGSFYIAGEVRQTIIKKFEAK